MTARWSRGYCVRMSVSSATATFLAARKQPRSSIERLMSTSSTVDVWVSCSVRWTSKSLGAQADPPVARAARAAGAFSSRPSALNSVPRRSRWNGSPNSYGLVVSSRSPPRPARSIRWPPNASRWRRANRSSRTFWPIRRLPARRELQPLAVAGQVAGLLEPAGEVVERLEIAQAVVAEQVADLVAIDGRQVGRRLDVRQLVRQPVHRLEPGDLAEGALEPERLVATERHPVAEAAGQQQVQVRGQLGEVDQQPVVAQERLHHRCELGALLRAHRAHQRLHGRHPLGELVDDVVERPGAREEPAVLGQELRRVRVPAADPLADELVEVAHHLAVRGQVLGRHRLDRLGHAGHELVEHLALEPLDELVEALARVRLEEVVVLQPADPLADVGRQAVELVEPLGRRRRAACRAGPRRPSPAFEASSSRRSTPGPLLGDDLVELAPDVAEDVVEPVPLEHLLALPLEALHQVAQAGHVAAGSGRPSASRAPSGGGAPRPGRPRP